MASRPSSGMRVIVGVASLALGLAAASARADVYTWVDAKGNVNVSNLQPPEGARVLHVAHESADAKARADAAREAARQAELRTLSERVAELEKKADAAPPMAPPVFYRAPAALPPPPPQMNVVVMPQDTPDTTPAYGCAWVGCGWPAFGYPVFFVGPAPRVHRDRSFHRFEAPRSPRLPVGMRPIARWGRS